MSRPSRFIHTSPTERSVIFAGEFLNLTEMAHETGLHITYLSHIFSANSPRVPSHRVGMMIADALGMEYGDFIREILLKKGLETAA
jgi:hypothetical protein